MKGFILNYILTLFDIFCKEGKSIPEKKIGIFTLFLHENRKFFPFFATIIL